MEKEIKKYLNWFWHNVNYCHRQDLEIGDYKIKVIQNVYDYISALIVYVYKGDDYCKYIKRIDVNKISKTKETVEEICTIIK